MSHKSGYHMIKAYLEPEEIKTMEMTADNLRDRLLVRLLFRLGCRVSEALALKVEDVDFVHGTVIILHLKIRLRLSCFECGANLGKSHAFCPGCGAKVEKPVSQEREHRRQRTLPVDSETLGMLRQP
jgi:integrase/recombinase XerD